MGLFTKECHVCGRSYKKKDVKDHCEHCGTYMTDRDREGLYFYSYGNWVREGKPITGMMYVTSKRLIFICDDAVAVGGKVFGSPIDGIEMGKANVSLPITEIAGIEVEGKGSLGTLTVKAKDGQEYALQTNQLKEFQKQLERQMEA